MAGDVVDLSVKMREPIELRRALHSMFLVKGEIVTELAAIKALIGVIALQSIAGGIGGAGSGYGSSSGERENR